MHFPKTSSALSRSLTLTALGALSLLGTCPAQAAEPRVTLSASPAPMARLRSARLLGRLDAAAPLQVGLVLPLRNSGQLSELVRHQYRTGDPQFHHFLTPADFASRFGPTAQDYAAVAAYARSQGLSVTGTSPGRTLLGVSGPAARVEAAFGVQMSRYRLAEGREVFANAAAPVLPRSIAVRLAGIAGLNNIARMHPHLMHPHAPVPITGTGSGIGTGPLGGLAPNDIKSAYDLSAITTLYGASTSTPVSGTPVTGSPATSALDGSGQSIGLFELDEFAAADIAKYASTFTLPTVLTGTTASVTPIVLNKFLTPFLSVEGQTEVTLDIDMVLALAPAATGVYVYEDNQELDASAPLTIFTRMANDVNPVTKAPLVSVISCSWGIAETLEDPTIISGENALFQQFAAQGQSLFCSSGDNGAYDLYNIVTPIGVTVTTDTTAPAVDNPASQPYATGVGGTTLSFSASSTNATSGVVTPGTYLGETVWSAGTAAVNPEGSGGGISTLWSKPTYQLGAGSSPNRRDVPDVSLNADPNTGYSIFIAGTPEVVGGTSAAAPLWAAYTALINQQRATNGLKSVGFMNAALYPILSGGSYGADFHDVTTGSNLFFPAGTGYDDATGLGSFVGAPLLAALSFNTNQGTGTATLSGTVTDTSATPVPIVGATVTAVTVATGVAAGTATTDTLGGYTLTVPSGLPLTITVTTTGITAPTTPGTVSTTGTVAAPVPVPFTGQSVTLAALTPSSTFVQNFLLPGAHLYPTGLQMISAPYDYTGIATFATVFGLTAAQANLSPRLVQYSPATNSYVFYPTPPADTLRLGRGYWIRFPAANYLHIPGNTAATTQAYSISLAQGWNQIGDPYPVAAPLATMGVTSATGVSGLLGAVPTVVQAQLYDYNTSTGVYDPPLAVATASLQPYMGYWIYAFQPATLSIPVPTGIPPVPVGGPPPAPGPTL